MAKLDDLSERVDRLVLRHQELKRTSALIEQQLIAVTAERDSLRSRLAAARARIDALLERRSLIHIPMCIRDRLFDHPLSPFAHMPLAERVSAGFDLLHRLAKEYEKPPFNITTATVDGVEVAVLEQVAVKKPFCRLLRFKRFTDNARALDRMKSQPSVLVVAPLSGNHASLLRDTVTSLLHDHKVFITDWTDARMVPLSEGPFHLADYVDYVQEFLRHIGPEVHVISVCQPTVPVLAAVSLMASRGECTPLTMTMMGGPIDARHSPSDVNHLVASQSHSLSLIHI